MATGKERSERLQVGALVLGALVLLGGFVVVLGSVSWRGGYRVYVDFDFSGNLQSGAPVKISGIKVGKVEEVAFWGGTIDPHVKRRVQVRATVWVEERSKEAIRQDAEFFINTAGVLGEQYLEVVPGSYDKPALPAASIVRGVDPPRTDLIVARLYEFLDSVTTLLRDDKDAITDVLRSGASMVRSIDDVLKENRVEIARLLKNVDTLTAEASHLVGAIEHGVGDASQLRRTLANVEALSASIRRDIDPLLAKTRETLDGVNKVTSMVGPEDKQKLERALDDLVRVGGKVDGIAGDAKALVGDVRRGKGTAGALLVDPQIYDDLKELVRDLKRNPWKFFWKE